MPQTIGGRQCHVAELADFEVLQKNCQFAFGVLYDDASTETSLNLSDVNGYAYYNASNTNKGMRGCFVFNPAGSLNSGGAGANIFFPVGVSGYGRRKHCAQENGKYGVLRYAARSALYTAFPYHLHQFRGTLLVQPAVERNLLVGHQCFDIRFQPFRVECVSDKRLDCRRRSQCQRRLLRPSGGVGGG